MDESEITGIFIDVTTHGAHLFSGGKQTRTVMSRTLKETKRNLRKQRGQSLIELALLLPLLLILVIGALEFGRLFYTEIVITNAAREGAYYLATHPSDFNLGTGLAPNTVLAAQTEANNSGIANVSVSVSAVNCCNMGEYSVVVTVESQVENVLILGLFGTPGSLTVVNDGTFPLSASVEMMVQ